MANQTPDPLQDLVLDGRARTMPYHTDADVVVLNVNLDLLCTRLRYFYHRIYQTWEPLRRLYSGTGNTITTNITEDINELIDLALWVCYNRLRTVAERYAPNVRTGRMNPKAPCSGRMEFPTFLSSTLQSIGPLRVTDGPHDVLILYAPPNGTMQHFGRALAREPAILRYERVLNNLKTAGVQTSPLDMNPVYGAYWTTCVLKSTDSLYDVIGTMHPTHYTNEDIAMAAFLGETPEINPFQNLSLTVGYVDDETTLTALAAVAAPADIPAGARATDAGRPTGLIYNVNYFGIQPAVAAHGSTPAARQGCYVLGRGVESIYTCYLARQIANYDVFTILRYRLTK